MRFRQFSLRAMLLVTTGVAMLLAFFAPFPYSIEEYWPDGTLRARCRVRRGPDGSLVAYGRQAIWTTSGQIQYDVQIWDVRYKSVDWLIKMDLAGLEPLREPLPPRDWGFQYVEGPNPSG
jgi:hypothetical protein